VIRVLQPVPKVKPVSRRLRRLPAVLLPLVLVAGGASACGNDSGSGNSSSSSTGALSAVSISGKPGEAPKVAYKKPMDATSLQTKVLVKGSGATVEDGDQVTAQIYVGNGFTKQKAFSTYDAGKPQQVTVNSQLSPVFADALKGRTLGSRIAVTAPADKAFGQGGNPQLKIGNKDSVLILVDLISKTKVLDAPQGAKQSAPAWAPALQTDGTKVTGLDFKGTPKPNGKLQSAALVKGDGATVQKGQTITVNYLGEVYGAAKPFDESYSRGEPASFAIGAGAVIPGWDKTLVGAKVGSRMILAIPPADGYGKTGNAQAGIKGTDTLYFVVDILAAG
jgi:peptidylprolyl isomerase